MIVFAPNEPTRKHDGHHPSDRAFADHISTDDVCREVSHIFLNIVGNVLKSIQNSSL